MKVYVLMYDMDQYRGVFSSIEKAVEKIKNDHHGDIKITRVEQVYGHFYEVYTDCSYTDLDTNEKVFDDWNSYTIIEEGLDGTEFFGRT